LINICREKAAGWQEGPVGDNQCNWRSNDVDASHEGRWEVGPEAILQRRFLTPVPRTASQKSGTTEFVHLE
jgi:hypothetical protein